LATKHKTPVEKIATSTEVEAAALSLADPEIRLLRKYAETRIFVIKGAADGKEPNELMNEAFRLTLDLTRKWNMEKTLVQHLKNVMQSLSGNWAEHYGVEMEQGRSLVVSGIDSRSDEVLADIAPDLRTLLDPLIPTDEEDREGAILALFEGDQLALDILNGRLDELTTDEIIEIIGDIDKTKYLSKVRWMQRKVTAAGLRQRTTGERGSRQ
jgi:hypothetical protein